MQYERMELNDDSRQEQERHAEVLRKYEAHKRGKSIMVPTAVDEVKARLRQLGCPITLFGEGHADRRERLREEIAKLELDKEELADLQKILNNSSTASASASSSGAGTFTAPDGTGIMEEETRSGTTQKEVIYSPASELLLEARKVIAEYSFKKAQHRLASAREFRDSKDRQDAETERILDLYSNSENLTLNSSQFADERPLTTVKYNPSGKVIAAGSLSYLKLWSSDLECLGYLRAHTDRLTSTAWHPQSGSGDGPALLCSTSADGSCVLWDCQNSVNSSSSSSSSSTDEGAMEVSNGSSSSVSPAGVVKHKLTGHKGIVSNAEFHPMGSFIGTSGHDCTWRLWDVESGSELLLQDGHAKECSTIAFHPDGSLAMSGDAGGVCLLWDLRSGQAVMPMQGHNKKITSCSFHCNGFQICTSGADNTVRIWDMRQKRCSYTLPAHPNIVSGAKFSVSGELLLTSSFDGTLKVWNGRDYSILRTASGHMGKVMASDFAPDEKHLVSAGYDRTLKIWAHRDEF